MFSWFKQKSIQQQVIQKGLQEYLQYTLKIHNLYSNVNQQSYFKPCLFKDKYEKAETQKRTRRKLEIPLNKKNRFDESKITSQTGKKQKEKIFFSKELPQYQKNINKKEDLSLKALSEYQMYKPYMKTSNISNNPYFGQDITSIRSNNYQQPHIDKHMVNKWNNIANNNSKQEDQWILKQQNYLNKNQSKLTLQNYLQKLVPQSFSLSMQKQNDQNNHQQQQDLQINNNKQVILVKNSPVLNSSLINLTVHPKKELEQKSKNIQQKLQKDKSKNSIIKNVINYDFNNQKLEQKNKTSSKIILNQQDYQTKTTMGLLGGLHNKKYYLQKKINPPSRKGSDQNVEQYQIKKSNFQILPNVNQNKKHKQINKPIILEQNLLKKQKQKLISKMLGTSKSIKKQQSDGEQSLDEDKFSVLRQKKNTNKYISRILQYQQQTNSKYNKSKSKNK